ncbi:MAG TPA: ABC transporter permease [Dehalococcoidia bacterium]|nr:ABC transporter permease [Dehalococcoidia bacterium]
MYFPMLIVRNVLTRKARTLLTGMAIAVSIMTVLTMGVLTESLERTATSIMETGQADFTIAQKGVSDILNSALDEEEVARVAEYEGVTAAVGVLLAIDELDADHPFFLQIGIEPDQLAAFGVTVIEGRSYARTAEDEILLGYRAARDLDKAVGDTIVIDDDTYRIVGLFSTGQVYGDSGAMLPLTTLQAREQKPGNVTLLFVQTEDKDPEAIDSLRTRMEDDLPLLSTARTATEFGKLDRNLALISAADSGVTIMALVIGGVIVMNTMMMSVFERTREFGVLRAIGWSRWRILFDVLGEAILIALIGAGLGVGLGFLAIRGLNEAPELVGVFHAHYTTGVFARAVALAIGMAIVGGLYPGVRAALLRPMEALRHE